MKSALFGAAAVAFALMASSSTVRAEDAPGPARTKEVVARELMEITGTSKLAMQVMQQMLTPLKQAIPDAPDEFWTSFMAEVNPDELVEKIVPIYCQHYSLDELEQLLAFNKTPLGQKVIREMPGVMKESMTVGQEWGRQLAERAMRKAKTQGQKDSGKS